jgi:hypothetical protein
LFGEHEHNVGRFGRLLFKIEMDQVKPVFRSSTTNDNNSPVPFFSRPCDLEGAVFDFSRAREISRKITIEDDPVKIDKLLSNLHEIVSKEFEKGLIRRSRRINAARRLNSTTHEEHA